MDGSLRKAFGAVKEEMNAHLETINQNTNEIQTCYEYFAELEAKMEKLSERLDALQCLLNPEERYDSPIALTLREQELFMVFYAAEDPVTAADAARRLGLTVEMVEQYVLSIISKGVPVLKTFANGKVYHSLDLKFKDLQARRNILNIGESVSRQLLQERAI